MDTNAPAYGMPPDQKDQDKKYIRTYAGDMATLKKGAVPDLAPFDKPPTPARPPAIVPPTLASQPADGGEESVPSPDPAERLIASSPFSGERIVMAPPDPEAAPPAPYVPAQKESAPIETYQSDFADKVSETNAPFVQVLAAEQDAGVRAVPEKRHVVVNIFAVIGGLILLGAGGAGVYVAYLKSVEATAPVATAPVAQSPIFVEERVQVGGTGDALLQSVAQAAARSLPAGSARLLYSAVSATTTGSDIFSQLPVSAPAILLRNIDPAGSIVGAIRVNGTQNPFFILSVLSYSDTFAGMLAWEPIMPDRLAPLFLPYDVPVIATTTATTTLATSTPVFQAGFYDEVVNNHDVRVYRDAEKRSILLYGYWDQRTLIIARDSAAFAAIMNRLASTRTSS